MKQINLIPWRENAREEQKKQFFNLLVLSLVGTLVLLVCIHLILANAISNQTKINNTYTQEITALDKQLNIIEQLKNQQKSIRDRINIIDKLQANRSQTAYIFSDMVRAIPQGVYLIGMKRVADDITLAGKAESNTIISNFMRNLEVLPWVQGTALNQIETNNSPGTYDNDFVLSIKLKPSQAIIESTDQTKDAKDSKGKKGKNKNAKKNVKKTTTPPKR